MPGSDSPFEILEKISPNAYKVYVLGEYVVSATFNVADLSPYYKDSQELPSLRANSNQEGGADGDQGAKDSCDPDEIQRACLSLEEIKKAMLMVREHLHDAIMIIDHTASFWP